MAKKGPGAWELYRSMFKDGEDVVLIDDEDAVHCGKIRSTKKGAWLKPPLGKEHFHQWVAIRFMSHDGFPVKRLMGADGSALIEKVDTTDTVTAIRTALSNDLCRGCGELFERDLFATYWDNCQKCKRKHAAMVFGDPFMIEPVESILFFPGNDGPEFWDEDGQEVLCMRATDGAMAQLFDLKTVYHMEMD